MSTWKISFPPFLGMGSSNHLGFESAVRYFCFRLVSTARFSSSTTSSGAKSSGHGNVSPTSTSPVHKEKHALVFPSRNRGPPVGRTRLSKATTTRDHEGLTKGPRSTRGPSGRAFATCQTLFREFWVRPRDGEKEAEGLVLNDHTQTMGWSQPDCSGQRAEIRRAPDARGNRPSGPRALRQVAGAAVGPDPTRAQGTYPGCGDGGGGASPTKPGNSLNLEVTPTHPGSCGLRLPRSLPQVRARTHRRTHTRAQTHGCTHTHPQANATWRLGSRPCLSDQKWELRPRADAGFP